MGLKKQMSRNLVQSFQYILDSHLKGADSLILALVKNLPVGQDMSSSCMSTKPRQIRMSV